MEAEFRRYSGGESAMHDPPFGIDSILYGVTAAFFIVVLVVGYFTWRV